MRDNENTIIEYDFTAADYWRERVVRIGPCPGKDPPLIGPNKWRHERIACDSGPSTEPGVSVFCTCGWSGPAHDTETAAIEAFNASLGLETTPVTDWLVHRRVTDAAEVDLPF